MSTRVTLSPRDLALLRLLSWTPATTALLLRARCTFDGEPFADERRLRERLQTLARAGFLRYWSSAVSGGGLQNYYKLTPSGLRCLHGADAPEPPRAFFAEVSPSLFAHTFRLAEVIVEILRATHARRVTIEGFYRENALVFQAGDFQVQPDCFVRLLASGKAFNLAFELDNSTASLDSHAPNSIRQKLTVYDAYQEQVLSEWRRNGKQWERPRFRVVFLTPTMQRAHHILALAGALTLHPTRRLVYAAAFDSFVRDSDSLMAPIFLDHQGHWQALVDLHPTSSFRKEPVRLERPIVSPLVAW